MDSSKVKCISHQKTIMKTTVGIDTSAIPTVMFSAHTQPPRVIASITYSATRVTCRNQRELKTFSQCMEPTAICDTLKNGNLYEHSK